METTFPFSRESGRRCRGEAVTDEGQRCPNFRYEGRADPHPTLLRKATFSRSRGRRVGLLLA